jgi:hypothetical protein
MHVRLRISHRGDETSPRQPTHTAQAGWLLGDGCNLAGALLARQLPTQVASAIFLLFMDALLAAQKIAYDTTLLHAWRRRGAVTPHGAPREVLLASCAANAASAAAARRVLLPQLQEAPRQPCSATPPRLLPWRPSPRARVGYALGCVSAAAFLAGAAAQVGRNRVRRSVRGVSLLMVALALLMNGTYAASVLLRVRSGADLAASAPWIVGSAGPALLDVVVLVQARLYAPEESRKQQRGAAGAHSAAAQHTACAALAATGAAPAPAAEAV